MEEAMAARYWCHKCSRMVIPILETGFRCPCESGFIEEIIFTVRDSQDSDGDFGSVRAFSLWVPILLGMMGNSPRRRRLRRFGFEDEDDDTEEGESRHGGDMESDQEIDSIIRRRRRSSAAILRLSRDARAGIVDTARDRDGDRDGLREREHVIRIDSFDQSIFLRGQVMAGESSHDNAEEGESRHGGDMELDRIIDSIICTRRRISAAILQLSRDARAVIADTARDRDGDRDRLREREHVIRINLIDQTISLGGRIFNLDGSVGDYIVDPGLDLPLRAEKCCSICLDQVHNGAEIGRLACKHEFHSGCISQWLQGSSSCPLCRFQLHIDVSRTNADGSGNGNEIVVWNMMWDRESAEGSGEEGEGNQRNENGWRFTFWSPLSWFSSNSGSHYGGGNSTSSPSGSSSNGREDASS